MPHKTHIFFFFNDTAPTEIYTLSLHDALPIWASVPATMRRLSDAWAAGMSAQVRWDPGPVRPSPRVVAPLPVAWLPSGRRSLGIRRVRIVVRIGVGVDREADGAAHEDADVSARRPGGAQEKEQGQQSRRHHPRASPVVPSSHHARAQHRNGVRVTGADCRGGESNPYTLAGGGF